MPQLREAGRRDHAGPRILPLAVLASGAAAALLALIWHDASRQWPAGPSQAVQLAQNALNTAGYDWARVSQRGSTVHLTGRAPDDGARVMAFYLTRQALRPMMGKDATVSLVRSHIGLQPGALKASGNRIAGSPPLDIAALLPPPMPLVHGTPDRTGELAVSSSLEEGTAGNGKADVTSVTEPSPEPEGAEDNSAADTTGGMSQIETASTTSDAPPPEEPQASQAVEPQAAPQAAPANVRTVALDPQPLSAPEQSANDCAAKFSEALSQSTIQFGRDSAAIDKVSRPLLDKLAAIARRCKGYSFTVEGHTDLTGSRTHNLELSRKRAEEVRWALIDRGIDMDHVSATGFGAARPLENATSDAANARNRRIVISVAEPARRR